MNQNLTNQNKNTWVFEIFSQPIPSKLQNKAAQQLKTLTLSIIESIIPSTNLSFLNQIYCFCTNRRLTLLIKQLPDQIAYETSLIKGPKINPENNIVLEKFCQKISKENNIPISLIQQNLFEENGYFYIKPFTMHILLEELLNKISSNILAQFKWIRSIKIKPNEYAWIRPIMHILSLLNHKQIGNWNNHTQYTTQYATKLHTYSNDNQIIPVSNADEYLSALASHNIELSYEKRLQIIMDFIGNKTHSTNMLEEIACSTETLHPFLCMDEELKEVINQLPEKYVLTCVEEHQQAVSIYENSTICAFLLAAQKPATARMIQDSVEIIKCRLKDTLYLFEEDKKTFSSTQGQKQWNQQLADSPIYKNLGSINDKIQRITNIIYLHLPAQLQQNLLKVAQIFKLDLASKIVSEFPVLHGYHIAQLIQTSQTANEEHINIILGYLMENNNISGLLLALLDKLDTLVSFFTVEDLTINSSQDPLGLKKIANDIIQCGILINQQKPLSDINILISIVAQEIKHKLTAENKEKLLNFMHERMIFHIKQKFNLKLSSINKSISTYLAIFLPQECVTQDFHTQNFWSLEEKAQQILSFDVSRIKATYKRLSNFVKNKTHISHTSTNNMDINIDTNTDPLTALINPFLLHMPNIQMLEELSCLLEEFFDNNLVLDPLFPNRQNILLNIKAFYDSFINWDFS